MKFKAYLATACLLASPYFLTGCFPSGSDVPQREELIKAESERLNEWFSDRYEEQLARSPMSQTFIGMKDNHDKLDDISQIAIDEEAALVQSWVEDLRRNFDIDRLDEQARLSFRLFEVQSERELATHAVAQNDYVFTHMFGPHTGLPSFLINEQRLSGRSLQGYELQPGRRFERSQVDVVA